MRPTSNVGHAFPIPETRVTEPSSLAQRPLDSTLSHQTPVVDFTSYQKSGGLTKKDISTIRTEQNKNKGWLARKLSEWFGWDELGEQLSTSKAFLKTLRDGKKPSVEIPTIFARDDLISTNKDGNTALILAAQHSYTDIATALIADRAPQRLRVFLSVHLISKS